MRKGMEYTIGLIVGLIIALVVIGIVIKLVQVNVQKSQQKIGTIYDEGKADKCESLLEFGRVCADACTTGYTVETPPPGGWSDCKTKTCCKKTG